MDINIKTIVTLSAVKGRLEARGVEGEGYKGETEGREEREIHMEHDEGGGEMKT